MNFLKSGSQYNYYTRENFKSRYLKTTLGTFFEKTIHGRGPKLGSYVPLMSFNNLMSGIYFKIFFSIFMAENVPKMVKISAARVHLMIPISPPDWETSVRGYKYYDISNLILNDGVRYYNNES